MDSKRKRSAVKWSFSPERKRTLGEPTSENSPKTRQIFAEKENALCQLPSTSANTSLLDLWKSPKIRRTEEDIITLSNNIIATANTTKTMVPTSSPIGIREYGVRSSLADSPTKKRTLFNHPASLVADIEDLGVGSSFFSETDICEALVDDEEEEGEERKRKREAETETETETEANLVELSNENTATNSKNFKRFLIHSIRHDRIAEGPSAGQPQIILSCTCTDDGLQPTTVFIRDLWIECNYRPGTVISITIGDSSQRDFIIDGSKGILLSYDPENLISVTTVADAIACLRKATLNVTTQVSNTDNQPTIHLVSGLVAHDVFEYGILGHGQLSSISELVKESIRKNLPVVYSCGQDEGSIMNAVGEILRGFVPWCSKFLRDFPASDALVLDELKASMPENSRRICLPKVYSLEESITAVGLGLKGKLDAVVLLRFVTGQDNSPASMTSLLAPLELKTGRSTSSINHRAQTLLYILLLADRYGLSIKFGLLYYVASNTLLRILATNEELQALMMTRNRLASACQASQQLPRVISNAYNCRNCSQLENCVVMTQLNRESGPWNQTIEEKIKEMPVDSSDSNMFYRRWEQLITLEEAEIKLSRKNNKSISEGVLLGLAHLEKDSDSFGRFKAEFTITSSLTEFEMIEGDPIAIFQSDSPEREATSGFIISLFQDRLVVCCNRDISNVLERSFDTSSPTTNHQLRYSNRIGMSFIFKREELMSGLSLARSNLVRLFSARNFRKKVLIADLTFPRFIPDPIEIDSTLLKGLDYEQEKAVRRCLQAEDYALLLGMPGTGKTTTLVTFIKILVSMNFRVLISSYTNSAVDNLLVKLVDEKVSVLRVGNADRVNDRIKSCLISAESFPTTTSLATAISKTLVFGTTCLGINNQILSTIKFDYCIIDEASQITVPAIIGPILMAKRFVLVGDHYQLPPLVKSRAALSLGLNQSLFKILAETHPETVATLYTQYRMCEDVQLLANKTVYQGKLQCGSDLVRHGCLNIPDDIMRGLFCRLCGDSETCWIKQVLKPQCRVCFLDTDALPALETIAGNSFTNPTEALLTFGIVSGLLSSSIKPERLCVISAFKPQIKLATDLINSTVEVSTVDRYQGRDKDCVIFSFVRSNPEQNIGTLLRDWHRLNVAFTRAKYKLIMIGSWRTLMGHAPLAILRDIIVAQKWYFPLPPQAQDHEIL